MKASIYKSKVTPNEADPVTFFAIQIQADKGGWLRPSSAIVKLVGMPPCPGEPVTLIAQDKKPQTALSRALDGRLSPKDCIPIIRSSDPVRALNRTLSAMPITPEAPFGMSM